MLLHFGADRGAPATAHVVCCNCSRPLMALTDGLLRGTVSVGFGAIAHMP